MRSEGDAPASEILESANGIRAAQYIRMSTEHQRYSTENQEAVIESYAAAHNFEIVDTYIDSGKSGLKIEGREGLKQLIEDVEGKDVGFEVILVYDVSRWGRFQDADESAYYEFICRRNGLAVHYCAEQFENDGSPVSTIVKGVKRAMAGEYSRELSAKVFAGQCRLIELGYRQGGQAGFGLRRMRVDKDGQRQGILEFGERKSLQTDRVILVPGPPSEVEAVRLMYRQFVDHGKQEQEIATLLNSQGRLTDFDRPWTRATVHQVLTNEKYIGNNVFNRQSFKLKKKRVRNDPQMWVRSDGAFEAIVDPEKFFVAQGMIRERSRKFSDEEMIEKLRHVFKEHGFLSALIIDEHEGMPSSGCYRSRFGSLVRAYELVGYRPDRDYSFIEINKYLRKYHADAVERTIAAIERSGGSVTQEQETELWLVNGEFRISIIVARSSYTKAGSLRWRLRLDTGLKPDITIALRMNDENKELHDYYVLPMEEINSPKLLLCENNGLFLDAFRFDTLDYFFELTKRSGILEVA